MTSDNHRQQVTVVAQSFSREEQAHTAIQALKDAGFSGDDISVVAQDRNAASDMAESTGTKTAEGTGIGAMAGGTLGAMGGMLAGAGGLAIPGIGPLVAAGPLATTLAGGLTGGLIGALTGLGIPENEAQAYQERFDQGDFIVVVDSRGREQEARQILQGGGSGSVTGTGTNAQDTTSRQETGYHTTEGMDITGRPS